MKRFLFLFCLLYSIPSIGQTPIIYDSLKTVLEKVYEADQQPRILIDSLQKKFSFSSPEVQQLYKRIQKQDSLNQLIVPDIIDKYGWIEEEKISDRANKALFLVIQHADLVTQLKYLPVLKKAVQDKKAKASEYALLLDRTNLKQGKFQVYGSQIKSEADGQLRFEPIIDEPNVNERRKAVGLNTMEEYAKRFSLNYKLPETDSLKNKVLLSIGLWNNGQHLKGVNIYLNSIYLGQTNTEGNFEKAVDKTLLPSILTFKKQGFQTLIYKLEDMSKDIFEITLELEN